MTTTNIQPLIGSLIGGQSVLAGGRAVRPVLDPATGEPVAMLALATEEDLASALENARRGHLDWSGRTPLERAGILKAAADGMRRDGQSLAAALTREQGKTLREAAGEVAGAADLIEWLAEEGKRVYGRVVASRTPGVRQTVLLEPVGPVAAFSPWNYPLALAARKVGHALAAGCSVVIKPAEETPSAVLQFARICIAAGVPADAVQVVFGEPAVVSRCLIESPVIRKITFTGSVPVGRALAEQAGRALKKATLELGGHAPVIVMDDVEVERAAEVAVAAKFRNAGQICISPTRFYVHAAIHDRFVAAFVRAAGALRVGDGKADATQMGPLTHARRVDAMTDLVQDAVGSGARLVAGTAERGRGRGFFWSPTVLCDVAPSARVFREEPFGPVAPFQRFEDLDAVIEQANGLEFGLAGYAFTRSLAAAHRIREGLQVGVLGLNTYTVTAPEMPFTGTKDSGLGTAQGIEGLLEHMNIKAAFEADR